LFYFTLFLLFLYFKIARVHYKEEKVTSLQYLQHSAVVLGALALYSYAFMTLSALSVIAVSFVFFIIAALMVTAVQLGIFVDGKPLISVSKLYKAMPILAGIIVILSLRFWSL